MSTPVLGEVLTDVTVRVRHAEVIERHHNQRGGGHHDGCNGPLGAANTQAEVIKHGNGNAIQVRRLAIDLLREPSAGRYN